MKIERLEETLDLRRGNTKFYDLLEPDESFKNIPDEKEILKIGQDRLLYRRKEIQEKVDILRTCSGIVDIFYFGFFEYKTVDVAQNSRKYSRKQKSLAIKNILQNSIENLKKSQFKLSRISIMDIRYGKIWEQGITGGHGETGMSEFLFEENT